MKKINSISIKMDIKIIIPLTPNFLQIEGSKELICIKDLSELELRSIGNAWLENLIEKSKS